MGDNFSNYTPPYLYLVWLATKLPLEKLYAVKIIVMPFDFLMAFFTLLIVRLKYPNRTIQMLAFFAALLAPTVVFNSALWGQSDAIYTSFLFASVYFILRKRPIVAFICFSIALSFKTQAIFLSPLFLVLYLKNRIAAWTVLLLPATYFVMVVPAWVAGRSLVDLFTLHWRQAETFNQLTMNAPNLYQWLPIDNELFGKFGLLLAATSMFLFCFVVYKSTVELDEGLIIKLSLLLAIMLPFLLPRMHERYFFPADVLAIIYAFDNPRLFYVPLVIGLVSLFSYFPFLFGKTVIGLSYLAFVMGAMLVVVMVDTVRALYPDIERSKRMDLPGTVDSKGI